MAPQSTQPEPEKDKARSLARTIALAQGNVFIKELLRKKGIPIGATKADFEKNMLEAIDQGDLTRADIDEWLREVEGWGNQHIYLYHIPRHLASDSLWTSTSRVKRKLEAARMDKLLNRQASLEFPGTRKLTTISHDTTSISFQWQQGLNSWLRTPDKDTKSTIDEDEYEFRAYRKRADRSIMRFEFRFDRRLAAVFMQIPWNKAEHELALNETTEAVRVLLDPSELKPFSTSSAIKTLDQAQLAPKDRNRKVTTQRTRLSDAGVYVEFASTSEDRGYRDSEAVRHVRLSLKTARFTGTSGSFLYDVDGPRGAAPTVKIDLFGEGRRVKIASQLTSQAVWDILEFLGAYG